MTPKPTGSSKEALPVSSSKGKNRLWKEKLRKSCLERLRRQYNHSSNNHGMGDDMPCAAATVTSPRAFVQQELQRQGIKVTPCRLEYNNDMNDVEESNEDLMEIVEDHNGELSGDGSDQFLSEDELYELFQEVQEEMARMDALHFQEGLTLQQQEEEYLARQIADFDNHDNDNFIVD